MQANPPGIWDIFCRVIDNYGDAGVCWRLARELGRRGQRVRLWIDDVALLQALAPGAMADAAASGHVRVVHWTQGDAALLPDGFAPAQVWIEAFGCDVPSAFVAQRRQHEATQGRPVWLNLEYLSAEPYAARSHGLVSPISAGPGAGWHKWFFYPGFVPQTGGLLREPDLAARCQRFDRARWLRRHLLEAAAARWRVLLFCYEPPALGAMVQQLRALPGGCHVAVAAGRSARALQRTLAAAAAPRPQRGRPQSMQMAAKRQGPTSAASQQTRPPASQQQISSHGAAPGLALTWLPFWPQSRFDALLCASDLNFVRGEDSLVRALWAGQPFVWQPYPQDDGAHAAKLEAFLDWLQAPPLVRTLHRVWSGLAATASLPQLTDVAWDQWQAQVRAARQRLLAQPDLATQLIQFVAKKR